MEMIKDFQTWHKGLKSNGINITIMEPDLYNSYAIFRDEQNNNMLVLDYKGNITFKSTRSMLDWFIHLDCFDDSIEIQVLDGKDCITVFTVWNDILGGASYINMSDCNIDADMKDDEIFQRLILYWMN